MSDAETTKGKRRPLPAPAEDDDALMNGRDVAGLLRTSPAHLYNMRARGQFPAGTKLLGLGLRWRRAEVVGWIDKAGQ